MINFVNGLFEYIADLQLTMGKLHINADSCSPILTNETWQLRE